MTDDDEGMTTFGRLTRGYHERQERRSDVQYEDKVVHWLLQRFRLPCEKTLRRKARRETGTPVLTFKDFNEEYPSFPLLLGTSRLGGIKLHVCKEMLLPALFRHFDQTPFVREYELFYEREKDAARGRALALVFPRNGMPRGLVIHDEDQVVGYRGLTLLYTGGWRHHPQHLYVRPFQALADALYDEGRGWRPE